MRYNLNPKELYFIPLGGSEQFGMNLNVYAYQDQLLIVDCGIGFAGHELPGIDITLPDPQFLEDNQDKIAGMIITHAHEDHIGAVGHLWDRLRCPIYCRSFAASVLKEKFKEFKKCKDAQINVVKAKKNFAVGDFSARFIPVTHSIPQTGSVAITTDLGTILHTGDWNLDPKPVLGEVTDRPTFQVLGDEGVIALIGDSTSAEVPGFSGSESDVEIGLAEVFQDCEGRIAVTIFSSNIGRLRSICKAAKAHGRKVCIMGRSLHKMVGVAKTCGYLDDLPEFLEEDDMAMLPREQVVIVMTGSQGEARAQLARVARGDHRSLKLSAGDTVIFSARPIPGNEKEINHVKNNLAASGVKTISPRETTHCIHVSGHPAAGEIQHMLEWTKPAALVAVHGERTMIEAHAALAQSCGIGETIVPNNGSIIRLSPGPVQIVDHAPVGVLAVEPGRIISTAHPAIAQRRKLQHNGSVHVSVVLDEKSGEILGDIKISTEGLIDAETQAGLDFEDDIIDRVVEMIDDFVQDGVSDEDLIAEDLRIAIRRMVDKRLRFKPQTHVHVVMV